MPLSELESDHESCESSFLFYLSLMLDFYVSKIMRL